MPAKTGRLPLIEAQTLLTRCRELGAELIPQPDGKLKVRAPAPLPDELQTELKERKAEVLSLLTRWTCPYCFQPLMIDEVCRSLDGERMLTLWRCDPCQVVGVTPDAVKKPPVWVKATKQ